MYYHQTGVSMRDEGVQINIVHGNRCGIEGARKVFVGLEFPCWAQTEVDYVYYSRTK